MLIALRDDIRFTRIHSGIWADRLEILAIEIEITGSKKIMLCVCYRSPRWNKPYLDEWLGLFTSFLEITTCCRRRLLLLAILISQILHGTRSLFLFLYVTSLLDQPNLEN